MIMILTQAPSVVMMKVIVPPAERKRGKEII
jgi:hypothetical protein